MISANAALTSSYDYGEVARSVRLIWKVRQSLEAGVGSVMFLGSRLLVSDSSGPTQ
jgi:hypothetical protein